MINFIGKPLRIKMNRFIYVIFFTALILFLIILMSNIFLNKNNNILKKIWEQNKDQYIQKSIQDKNGMFVAYEKEEGNALSFFSTLIFFDASREIMLDRSKNSQEWKNKIEKIYPLFLSDRCKYSSSKLSNNFFLIDIAC